MEVHAHTHTTRKNWTHYFWEFLMLFLDLSPTTRTYSSLNCIKKQNHDEKYFFRSTH